MLPAFAASQCRAFFPAFTRSAERVRAVRMLLILQLTHIPDNCEVEGSAVRRA